MGINKQIQICAALYQPFSQQWTPIYNGGSIMEFPHCGWKEEFDPQNGPGWGVGNAHKTSAKIT